MGNNSIFLYKYQIIEYCRILCTLTPTVAAANTV